MSADVGKTVYGIVPAMTREEYYGARGERHRGERRRPHSRDRFNEPPKATPIT